MQKVTIEINSKWVRIAHSPLFWIVSSLQGVAFTFAPLFLYWCGKGELFVGKEWVIVPLCFVVIFGVGAFYLLLGGAVFTELRKK